MARVIGYGGSLWWNAANIVGIREWSMDYVVTPVDTSGYDSGQDKEFLAGQREWSGTFAGPKNQAPLPIAGAIVVVILYETNADATRKWEGNAFITGIHPTSAIDGIVQYSYDFQGTGTIATVPTA